MKYEEVKNLYNSNEFQEIICHSKLCNYANTGCSDCKITHMNILINEALEKQIPKKPKYKTWADRVCPVCGLTLNWIGYPCRCGQVINWED